MRGGKLKLFHLFETVLALSRRDLRRRVEGTIPVRDTADAGAEARRAAAGGETQGGLSGRGGGIQRDGLPAFFFEEDCRCQGLPTFEEVFQTVAQGGADYGVVPIENSSTGAIRQVYELLGRYECYIVGRIPSR